MAKPSAKRCPPSLRSAALASAVLSACLGVAAASAADPAAPRPAVNLALLQGPGLPGSVQDLYLEVFLNTVNTHKVMHVAVDAQNRYHAWSGNLREVGLRLDDASGDRYVPLDELPGLEHRYDPLEQRLHLDATGTRLNAPLQTLNAAATPMWPATAGTGALLNYDLYATTAGGDESLSAFTELRVFQGDVVLDSTGLSRLSERGDDRHAYLRLDTAVSWSQQDALWTLTAGDFVSGGLPWSRSTRMGGVQLRRNFNLQPQLITYPLPQFFGDAAVPSSIELYVNGIRQYRGEVLPGPFQVNALPQVNGTGQARLVVTDALGRSRSIDFDYYNATRLLRRGLADYSLELGAVRRDYGIDAFDYRGDAAASGSLRYGWTDSITVETHAEGTGGLFAGGAGGMVRLGLLGSVNAACALSHDSDAGGGSLLSTGYTWTGDGLTVDYQLARTIHDYRDIATRDGRAPSLRAERALLGYGMGAGGNVSLHYARLDTLEEGRFRSVGLNYSVGLLDRLSLYVGAARELDEDRGDSVFAGISASLGPRVSAGASASRNRGQSLYDGYLIKPVPADGGAGWSLRTQRGDGIERYQAEAGYRGDRGQVGAGAWSLNGDDSAYASASGALVMMDRDLFAARRVDDGFALVSAGGVAGVPVLLENRSIGRTDARGHYLLTGLNAYQANHVSIDPLHLPPQIQFDRASAVAVPADRAGVTLDFGLHEVRAALLIVHDAHGQPIPLGSRVERSDAADAAAAAAIVGYDGQVYLENLSPQNRIRVIPANGTSCTLDFAHPGAAGGIPVIGPLTCRSAP